MHSENTKEREFSGIVTQDHYKVCFILVFILNSQHLHPQTHDIYMFSIDFNVLFWSKSRRLCLHDRRVCGWTTAEAYLGLSAIVSNTSTVWYTRGWHADMLTCCLSPGGRRAAAQERPCVAKGGNWSRFSKIEAIFAFSLERSAGLLINHCPNTTNPFYCMKTQAKCWDNALCFLSRPERITTLHVISCFYFVL